MAMNDTDTEIEYEFDEYECDPYTGQPLAPSQFDTREEAMYD